MGDGALARDQMQAAAELLQSQVLASLLGQLKDWIDAGAPGM